MRPTPPIVPASHRALLLTLLLAVCLACPASAQSEAAEPAGTFAERVDVDLVQLEVRVLDDDGVHVSGLEREDFRVEVDGRRADLSLFSEVHLADTATAAEAEPVHLLLMVDQVHLDGGLSEEALVAVGAFLDGVAEGGRGRVAVVEATAGGMSLVQPFTADPTAAMGALRVLDLRPSAASASAEYRRLKNEIRRVEDNDQSDARGGESTLSRDEMPFAVKSQIDAVSERSYRQLARTALQVDRVIGGLAGLPGRKSLVIVTGSLPTQVARELNTAWNDAFGNQSDYRSEPSLNELTGVPGSFYNPAAHVGTESADTGGIFDVLAQRANVQGVTLHVLGSVVNTEASQRVDDPTVVHRMARRTGGRSVIGPDAHRVLDAVAADLDSYYVLAFTPPGKPDPAKGPLDVEVELGRSHKGLELHHRESVLPTNLEQRGVRAAVSALLLGGVTGGVRGGGTGGLEIVVEPPTAVEGRDDLLRLPATILIPLGALDFVESGGVHQGRVSLFFTTGDLERGASNVQKVEGAAAAERRAAGGRRGAQHRVQHRRPDAPRGRQDRRRDARRPFG